MLPYHWKGMNERQREEIRQTQNMQISQKQMQRDLEAEEDRLFAAQMEAQRKAIVLQDRAKNKGLKEVRQGMDEYNKLKAQEMRKKAHNAFNNTQTYKNE